MPPHALSSGDEGWLGKRRLPALLTTLATSGCDGPVPGLDVGCCEALLGGDTVACYEDEVRALCEYRFSDRAFHVGQSCEAAACSVLGDDLVLHHRYDAGSGSTAVDSSGNGNDGAVQGALWSAGQSGGALWFDGVDDEVTVADDPSLDLSGDYTLSAWGAADLPMTSNRCARASHSRRGAPGNSSNSR